MPKTKQIAFNIGANIKCLGKPQFKKYNAGT